MSAYHLRLSWPFFLAWKNTIREKGEKVMSEKTTTIDDILQKMADSWPSAIVARTEVAKFSGGAVAPKYLANLDSLRMGPRGAIRINGKVCYTKDALIEWLRGRMSA